MKKDKTVDLSGIRDIDLDSITVRQVDGDDTMDAASRCIPPSGQQLDGNLFGMLLRQQLLFQAITSYTLREDKKKVVCAAPPVEAAQWCDRTKEFVGEIYDYLNSVTRDERDAFRKALAEAPAPGSAVATPG